MDKSGLHRESLSKQVSDRLEELIASGEYKVGDKIPTEPELMEMFSVSRNTIREAIRSLTWAGLLTVRQGDGTYVECTDRFKINMEQKYKEFSMADISEARNFIEVTVVHLAALRRTQEDLTNIYDMLLKRKSLISDVKENTRADLDFHIAIARACHNQILIDMYDSISGYMESQIEERTISSGQSFEVIDRLHEELYNAIRDSDEENAVKKVMKILEI